MESLGNVINSMSNKAEIRNAVKVGREQILADADVRYFLNQNSTKITEEIFDRDLLRFDEFVKQKKHCPTCNELSTCPNLMKGYRPELECGEGVVTVVYKLCDKGQVAEKARQMENLISTVHMPVNVKKATFASFDSGDGDRNNAITEAYNFVENYVASGSAKGLYLHGAFGVGKSFILGAIANQLAQKGVQSAIVHWSDFLRELKGSFGDNTSNKKIESLREVPVLLIDDIGAESNTSWSRDDVLGTILQYRMNQNLPTCFTSNFNIEEIEQHFASTQNGSVEAVKSKRIIERIKYVTIPVSVSGRNRRE